jgi:hypothetical protein
MLRRPRLSARRRSAAYAMGGGVALLGALTACSPSLGTPGDTDSGTDGGDGDDGGGVGCQQEIGPDGTPRLSCLSPNKSVDILFVIDNSGSMGEEQANLAANFGAFIDVLEDPAVRADYRIGVTTVDNGNPWCGATTPEGGALVYSSCLDRLGEFTNAQGTVNVEDLACRASCSLTNADLGIDASTKPWLERIEGTTNLPSGISTTEAFQCLGPQGISGCGFESQLESMHKALLRAEINDDPAHGFIRENAILAIVHVTDEVDCSHNPDWSSIFETSGNRVFWADPNDPFPSSAVCWNAGTACTGDPANYDCVAQSRDLDGDPIDADDPTVEFAAVLYPVSRYVDHLQALEDEKKAWNPGMEVIVALIAGVTDAGEPQYADSADAAFMHDFGIGPGCSAPVDGSVACTSDADCAGAGNGVCGPNGWCLANQTAVPPVRLVAFAEAFTPNNMFSICSNDYSPALGAVADAIADQIRPACYTECAADTDPTTSELDPTCSITQSVGSDSVDVAECARDPSSGWYLIDPQSGAPAMPNVDTNVCFVYRIDPDGSATADPTDAMSETCVDEGYNLEFAIERRPGFPAPGDATMSATCALSEQPAQDCPGL